MDSTKDTTTQTEKKAQDAAQGVKDGFKATFEDHKANPGPAIPKEFNVQQEGTKEERRAKAAELNK
ncbi:hypothetical protein DL546_000217 [Coniochaeta pulveracea]|uniref:Uncharacterized protein n=1 Tax=Coniochaeta pulveracea TaxID=177199 RepID=A0A420XW42_9PEZI|nr:hypothetical protein DL546_000217 [Coniochaeta pulveracea]